MTKNKRKHPAGLKARIALDLIQGEKMSEICSRYEIHPTQASKWKEQALEGLERLFTDKRTNEIQDKNETINELYRQIGQLKVESDWLKKKLSVN
jgi:transposase-like protein